LAGVSSVSIGSIVIAFLPRAVAYLLPQLASSPARRQLASTDFCAG
jgi:hypothetical protein